MKGNGVAAPLRLERVELGDVDWAALDGSPDRLLFQTPEWVQFIARSQRAEPVVARVCDGREPVGYFTGLIVRRCGMRILGSPFPGWTTDYMGFNLDPAVDRRAAAAALLPFAFGAMRCVHVELKDRYLAEASLSGLDYTSGRTMTFEVDLTADEPELLARMSSACRRAIRKAEKGGVQVDIVADECFAAEYYHQLRDVFAKQSLVPTYREERVRELIRCLGPTGRLLLLRALAPDGRCIATALFPAAHGTAYFWGGASLRPDQILRPNELLFWTAMKYWKARGMTTLDCGGAGEYKRKYGGQELWVPWYRSSRYPGLPALRDAAKAATDWRQRRTGARAKARDGAT